MSKREEAEWAACEAGWAWRDVELLPDGQDSVETQLPENATNNLPTEDSLKNINGENWEMRHNASKDWLDLCIQYDPFRSARIINPTHTNEVIFV